MRTVTIEKSENNYTVNPNASSGGGELTYCAFKLEDGERILWTDPMHFSLFGSLPRLSSMNAGYNLLYDDVNDSLIVTGDYAGTYLRDAANDLYKNS